MDTSTRSNRTNRRMTGRDMTLAICALVAAAGLAMVCGSGSGPASNASTSSAPAPASTPAASGPSGTTGASGGDKASASASLPSACGLLSEADVTPIFGTPQAVNPETSGGQGSVTSCTWGSLVSGKGLVSVAVSRSQDAGINLVDVMVSGSGGTKDAETVAVSDDGRLLARGVMLGGGGVGKTVYFHKLGLAVMVAGVGDRVDTKGLVAAAQHVADALK